MACPGGTEIGVNIQGESSCSGGCWEFGASGKADTKEEDVYQSTREDGIYENHDEEWAEKTGGTACTDGCVNGCAVCSGQCGNECTGCGSSCSSGCSSGCSGGCKGGCSGGCTGTCRGTCSGGCQGNCQGQCNRGCSNAEQVGNVTELERIVRAPNIQKIFKFLAYEIEIRRNKSIPQVYKDNINQLTGWKKDQEESLMALYYTVPRIFERIFNDILKDTSYKLQSGSLDPNNEYIPYFPVMNLQVENIPSVASLSLDENSISSSISKIFGYPGTSLPYDLPDYLSNNGLFKNLWDKYRPGSSTNPYYPPREDKNNPKPNKPNENPLPETENDSNGSEGLKETITNPSEYKWWADRPSAELWVKKANELYNELIGIYDAR